MYAADLAVNPQKAYESIVADLRVVCGNFALARASMRDAGRTAPVYASVVSAEPSHPIFIFHPDYGIRYAAHLLDLLALLGIMGGAHAYNAQFNTTGDLPRFVERDADRAETRTLREAFLELAATGAISRAAGWAAVDSGGRGTFTGVDVGNWNATPVVGMRKEVCEYYEQHGFGPDFWWAD